MPWVVCHAYTKPVFIRPSVEYVIGRTQGDSALCFPDDVSTSRLHAVIRVIPNSYDVYNPLKIPLIEFEDKSRHGSRVNDTTVTKSKVDLTHGSVISVGAHSCPPMIVFYFPLLLVSSSLKTRVPDSTSQLVNLAKTFGCHVLKNCDFLFADTPVSLLTSFFDIACGADINGLQTLTHSVGFVWTEAGRFVLRGINSNIKPFIPTCYPDVDKFNGWIHDGLKSTFNWNRALMVADEIKATEKILTALIRGTEIVKFDYIKTLCELTDGPFNTPNVIEFLPGNNLNAVLNSRIIPGRLSLFKCKTVINLTPSKVDALKFVSLAGGSIVNFPIDFKMDISTNIKSFEILLQSLSDFAVCLPAINSDFLVDTTAFNYDTFATTNSFSLERVVDIFQGLVDFVKSNSISKLFTENIGHAVLRGDLSELSFQKSFVPVKISLKRKLETPETKTIENMNFGDSFSDKVTNIAVTKSPEGTSKRSEKRIASNRRKLVELHPEIDNAKHDRNKESTLAILSSIGKADERKCPEILSSKQMCAPIKIDTLSCKYQDFVSCKDKTGLIIEEDNKACAKEFAKTLVFRKKFDNDDTKNQDISNTFKFVESSTSTSRRFKKSENRNALKLDYKPNLDVPRDALQYSGEKKLEYLLPIQIARASALEEFNKEEEIRKTKEKDLEDFLSEEKNKNPITKPRLISVDPIIPKPVIPAQIRMRVPVSKK